MSRIRDFFLKQCTAYVLCRVFIITTVTLFSCKGNKDGPLFSYETKEIEINKDGILLLTKSSVEAGKSFGSQFVDANNQIVICGLHTPSSVYYYFLQENRYEMYDLPFDFDFEKDRIHFDEEAITLFHDNNLLSYTIREEEWRTIKTDILLHDEFLKKELYGGGIYKGVDSYILNYGKINQGNFDNFIDKHAAYLICNDSLKKILPYTEEFEHEYVHYNELLVLQDSQYVYYTFSTIPKLVQYDKKTDRVVRIVDLEDKGKYKKYDHAKITDMGYLTTYSYNTNYNLRLFSTDDFVILLTYGAKGTNTPSKSEWVYHLHAYDKTLNLLDAMEISTPVLRNYVSSKDNSIYFSNISGNKIQVYTFSK